MAPTDNTQAEITQAIVILQDAAQKAAFNPKAVRKDIVTAVNILNGLLGLKGVAPDNDHGL